MGLSTAPLRRRFPFKDRGRGVAPLAIIVSCTLRGPAFGNGERGQDVVVTDVVAREHLCRERYDRAPAPPHDRQRSPSFSSSEPSQALCDVRGDSSEQSDEALAPVKLVCVICVTRCQGNLWSDRREAEI